ncbi:DUF732 domain-containing protein [Mycobacterium sp. 236(2023)]|uniref:DUF732 domain-containing protein n=1 Tax=Mycobacterium sp. 236(2023) TaxID=3038163 RepID=UPI0024159068|nr:DUF732 domain-containing protein [Mycobacterium sp. 236(2023)]MDG4667996.1 DUF732 domain-containing protein [Mycobacterium sp. 236(2023)]
MGEGNQQSADAATDDDTPTNYAPTELAAPVDDTEAHTAWSLEEYVEPERRTWPIVALAVAGAVVAIAIASGLALHHARQPQLGDVAMVAPSVKAEKPDVPEVGPSGFEIPPPPPPTTVTVIQPIPTHEPIDNTPLRPPVSSFWTPSMDAALLANLEAKGWTLYDPPQAIATARRACATIDEEQLSYNEMVARLSVEAAADGVVNPWKAADDMVNAAMYSYEPCWRR